MSEQVSHNNARTSSVPREHLDLRRVARDAVEHEPVLFRLEGALNHG